MEKLNEAGRRLERLLYMSIFFIVASFVFLNLSIAVSADKSQLQFNSLSELRLFIDKNKKNLSEALNIETQYADYSLVNKNLSPEYIRSKRKEKEQELLKQNIARVKLGLEEIKINEDDLIKKGQIEGYALLKMELINSVSKELGGDIYEKIEDVGSIYHDVMRKKIITIMINDTEMMEKYLDLIRKNKDLQFIMKSIEEQITSINSGSVKVFDVDTPVQVPFSLGDVKTKVSIYNIHFVSLVVLPLFLIVWFGSIVITRARELFFLRLSGDLMSTYPHFLNIFCFIDEFAMTGKENIKLYSVFLMGGEGEIRKFRGFAYFLCFIRCFISIVLLLLMSLPFYIGSFLSLNTIPFGWSLYLICCGGLNLFQIVIFIFNECAMGGRLFTNVRRGDVAI